MTKSCYFKEVIIFGLSSSAIKIDENVQTTLINCIISSCTSSDGAGIHTKDGSLNMTKTCIEKCRASVEGSAIRSYCDTFISLSSVSRCAEITRGKDDTIDIQDNSIALVNDLNNTNSYTEQAIFQILSCSQAIFSRCLFSKGMATEVICYHIMSVIVRFEDCVVTNNSVSSAIFLIQATKPLCFSGSIFVGNKSPKMLVGNGISLPQITFENVVVIENYTIGYDVSYSTRTNHIPIFDELKETFICYQKDLEKLLTLKYQFDMKIMMSLIFWQYLVYKQWA